VTASTPHLSALRAALSPLASLRAGYVFGSRVWGGARPDSDLDVGVVYAWGLGTSEREQARRHVLAQLSAELGELGERADLVDLYRTDSAVAFRAIREGVLVFARSSSDRVAVEVDVARRYDDEAPRRGCSTTQRLASPADGPAAVVDAQIVVRRLLVLSEALQDLARPEARDGRALAEDRVLRAAVERWLQVAIESCIDLAYHVAADAGWPPSESARSAFLLLTSHGVIAHDLAERLGRAAGLRNLLVHDYVSVDLATLAHVVAHDLGDLRTFAAAIAALLPRAEEPF
jgi:uncharacterized protein YutE (UPF0331/DUF86 family)/predicted nucleotidyltransferase